MISSSTKSDASSGQSCEVSRAGLLHDSSKEPTISAPKPSPIHHVSHNDVNLGHSAAPPRHKLKLPTVALTSGAATAAHATNTSTSLTESSDSRQRTTRNSNQYASNGKTVFPIAMLKADAIGMLVIRFAAKAPAKIPGQSFLPKISSEAIAIPAGG